MTITLVADQVVGRMTGWTRRRCTLKSSIGMGGYNAAVVIDGFDG